MIKERLPDIETRKLHLAMKLHTSSTSYLKLLSSGVDRFDLNGNVAGTVTPEQQKQALDSLRERFRKVAEQRKAEQQVQEKQQKLILLAEKFNGR